MSNDIKVVPVEPVERLMRGRKPRHVRISGAVRNIMFNELGLNRKEVDRLIQIEIEKVAKHLLQRTGSLYTMIEKQVLKYAVSYGGEEKLNAMVKEAINKAVKEQVTDILKGKLQISISINQGESHGGAENGTGQGQSTNKA